MANLEDVLRGAEPRAERETKGIDVVRREFCDFSKLVQNLVLDLLLDKSERDEIFSKVLGLAKEIKYTLIQYN